MPFDTQIFKNIPTSLASTLLKNPGYGTENCYVFCLSESQDGSL